MASSLAPAATASTCSADFSADFPPADAAADQADQAVQSAIADVSHIATLPEVTMRIIELVENSDSTAQDLNHVISHDPALGARILKVVNSAFYGLPGQIGSINRAIVLLGLNAVKNIAIAASLAKLFRGGRISPNFDARDLWTHAIATAAGSRLLAQRLKLGLPDEAFLAGLIHNLGIMVEMQARRPGFIDVLAQLDDDHTLTLRQAERQILSATHEQFGAGLCQSWKFPRSFIYVTGFHHHPQDVSEQNRTLTVLVHRADLLAARCGYGFFRGAEPPQGAADLLAGVGLTDTDVDHVAEVLPAAVDEAKSIFGNAA